MVMKKNKAIYLGIMSVVLSLGVSMFYAPSVMANSGDKTVMAESSSPIQLRDFNVETIPSAWTGHRPFAEWLVNTIKPKEIVDLGVDYGYSTFVFSLAACDMPGCTVTGVDLFEGDPQTGIRNTYNQVLALKEKHNLTNLELVQGDFYEVSLIWKKAIDILHIDGYHSYEAVSENFTDWSKFVDTKGIILFHDINVDRPDFQVIKLFRELTGGRKLYFLQSYGLGIYTKNDELADLILKTFPNAYDFDKTPF